MKKIPLTILFCLCIHFISAQAVGDYQTGGSGTWSTLGIWQTWNGAAWVAPAAVPNSTNGVITIQAGHTVTLNVGGLNIDQVIVNGTLQTGTTAAAGNFTVANGAGVDLLINGTFWDLLTTGAITWAGTWQFGAAGTLLKTSASSSNNWQTSYNGGAATMPSTANWIVRKVGLAQPSISTIGAYYPNLFIENNQAANWTTPIANSFTGLGLQPIILGNFDVGGNGTGTVDFMNSNTNATPMLVHGNVNIRAGNNFRNFGTGFEVRGNLTVNGGITYDANDGRRIVFGGGNAQSVSGTGALNVWDCTLNKSGNAVTLNRVMTINNQMTFTAGIINTTAVNLLIFASTATVAGANNTSFANGPVRYFGTAAFTFPVGKNSDYQPLAISGYTPTGGTFWTENFNNGCTSGCLGSAYAGANGAWSVSITGVNGPTPNLWFVSCAENGVAVGGCGAGCGANATLHLGAVGSSDCGCLVCPSGDCGAAYDACTGATFCGSSPMTDQRAESPTINCTGRASINLSFKYIENGQGLIDNATVWYFDGAVWAQLSDPAKTPTTCAPQGTWTAYSVALPASADNNPNVKIGFRWVNNADGAGNDPSFAVDDVELGTSPESFTAEYFYANPQVVYNNNLAPTLSLISACEYWILDRLPVNSTAATSVTLTWDGNSCPAIPQVTDTRVAHFDLVTWQDEGNGGNTGTTAAGTVVSAAPVTYFSPFTIGLVPTTPLPIEMLRFDGSCTGNIVLLKWSTATETDNDFFTIERSVNGSAFSAIGNLDGAGNSTHVLNYYFDDTDPFAGTNYYRIKQTDHNGHYSYSKIIVVDAKDCENKNLQLVNTFFNADDLEIDYRYAAGPVTIEIYNAEGRLVEKITNLPPASDHHIDAAGWGKSIYFIRVTDGVNTVSGTVLR